MDARHSLSSDLKKHLLIHLNDLLAPIEIDGTLLTLGKSRSGAVAGNAASPPPRVRRTLPPMIPTWAKGMRFRGAANAVEEPSKILATFAKASGAAPVISGGGPSDESCAL